MDFVDTFVLSSVIVALLAGLDTLYLVRQVRDRIYSSKGIFRVEVFDLTYFYGILRPGHCNRGNMGV
jgi:hypothetical protein